MKRLLIVFLLGCLLLCLGTCTLGLVAWGVVASGAPAVARYLIAVGLATLLPTSFVVAGGIVPGPPRPLPTDTGPSCNGMDHFFLGV